MGMYQYIFIYRSNILIPLDYLEIIARNPCRISGIGIFPAFGPVRSFIDACFPVFPINRYIF